MGSPSRLDVLTKEAATAEERRIYVPSSVEVWGWAIAAALCTSTILLLTQWLVYIVWLQQEGFRLVSPIGAGLITGFLTYRLKSDLRQRKLRIVRRLEVIAELNHHIRNSLQVLSYQSFAADKAAAERLREAVDRIEWVLRELLPEVHE